jgi:molecular chaperone DnaK
VFEGGVPQVVPNQEDERSTPSVVALGADGRRLVGKAAKRQALPNPESTIFGAKRLIGRKFDSPECRAAQRFAPFRLVPAPNGDAHVLVGGRVYSPPEIASFVLQKLKTAAEDHIGEAVEEAIITVPASFDDAQRQATRDAGLIAGLKVARILNEPTAAALANGLKVAGPGGKIVAVYDLGGGTFDVTILGVADGLVQVRATAGNTFLGGDDFDECLMAWLLSEYAAETGVEVPRVPALLLRLRETAENAKRELAIAEESEIVLPFLFPGASVAHDLGRVLGRSQYESLTHHLMDQTVEPCRRCLADARIRADQVDEVLLVGGQSRAPGVVDAVRRIFGREPRAGVSPEEAVALGAAVLAGVVQGEARELALLDVTPCSLGIETKGGAFAPLIERNSKIPARKARLFTTVVDNQARVEVHVLQGDNRMAARNRSLCRLELADIPPAPRGTPQIEVGFEIDVNGIVQVTAQDQASGRPQPCVVHPTGGLSPIEVGRLAAQTRAQQADERERKEREATLRQLDGLVANTIRSVSVLWGRLSPDDVPRIFAAVEAAKKTKAASHPTLDDLRSAMKGMERAAGIVGQALLPRDEEP